eukprot:TRINITY_DN74729_c0_g1_i1.p1 TRINITY_DN74729_c0_g1~~TRINITY_DN74729_c0_g1_i1.p1  ORF type:complete len:1031 (-),score=136.51 TRINITY_DN74729_c0_g1_i1:15-3107(-)
MRISSGGISDTVARNNTTTFPPVVVSQPTCDDAALARSHHPSPSMPAASTVLPTPSRPSTSGGRCTPRNTVIRSRVMLYRTSRGVHGALPPEEILQVGDLGITTSGGVMGTQRSTHHIGHGALKVPIELAWAPREKAPSTGSNKVTRGKPVHSLTSAGPDSVGGAGNGAVAGVVAQTSVGGGGEVGAGEVLHCGKGKLRWGGKRKFPELSFDLHAELRDRLNNLEASCKMADFKSNSRAVRYVLKEVQEMSNMMDMSLIAKPYRSRYAASTISSFAFVLPPAAGAEQPTAAELRSPSGLWNFTMFTALLDPCWMFTYNGFTHKICDCSIVFPCLSPGECVVPADADGDVEGFGHGKDSAAAAAAAAVIEFARTAQLSGAQHQAPGNTGAGVGTKSTLFGRKRGSTSRYEVVAAVRNSVSVAPLGRHAPPAVVEARLKQMREQERHLLARLPELAHALRQRFYDLTGRAVPALMEEFREVRPRRKRTPADSLQTSQVWERFVSQFASEVGFFDIAYMQFEELFLELLGKVTGNAIDPLLKLSDPSMSLVRAPSDPFSSVQAAVLCQRLGSLKRRVDFGGEFKIVDFDPTLLSKAKRILQMQSSGEVCKMALALLSKFDGLCQAFEDVSPSNILPELNQNLHIGAAVVELEKIWAECQFVLLQDSLDFLRQLLDFFPRLSSSYRWLLRVSMGGSCEGRLRASNANIFSAASTVLKVNSVPSNSAEEQKQLRTIQEAALTMLFETVPQLMYIDEVWREVCEERTVDEQSAIEARMKPADPELSEFRALFCVKDERHKMVRKAFEKYDAADYDLFRRFLLQEVAPEEIVERATWKSFVDLYKTLREVAAFAVDTSPLEAVIAAISGEERKLSQGPGETQGELLQRRERLRATLQARARWVCLQRVAQTEAPASFPEVPAHNFVVGLLRKFHSRAKKSNSVRQRGEGASASGSISSVRRQALPGIYSVSAVSELGGASLASTPGFNDKGPGSPSNRSDQEVSRDGVSSPVSPLPSVHEHWELKAPKLPNEPNSEG